MAVGKEIDNTSFVVVVEGGFTDDGKPIKLRRTLANVSNEVTPEHALETIRKLFALQVHPMMDAKQVEAYNLYIL